MLKGYIHSIETFGAVDGPGIRYVIFTQGCPLRCKYCHNPDTWQTNANKQLSVKEITDDIIKYRNFIKSGGVTITGGEPLLQIDFIDEIVSFCNENNIHVAIDTSGIIPLEVCASVIDKADLILLDIKHIDPSKCQALTGQTNKNALALLEYCEKTGKKVWIRQVIVPKISDDLADLEKLAKYLSRFTVIEKVEILPFHKMGEFKWDTLGYKYELSDTPTPSSELISEIKKLFKSYNIKV
ncbi:MAG: pyruvate formate-lyase-activating protein [Erysipelotrichaceae bacterium]